MDTEGRWMIKRGRRRPPRDGEPKARGAAEIAVLVFGYKNRTGVDGKHGSIRSFAVTDADSDGIRRGRSCGDWSSHAWSRFEYR
jgi:IS5 family transposase